MTDPARLRAQAAALRAHADRLVRLSGVVRRLVGVRWHGRAADRFRDVVDARAAELMEAGAAADDAAVRLHLHADALEDEPR